MITPCLHCGQPSSQQIAAQARLTRGTIEILLNRLGWPTDSSISAFIDRLLVLEEAAG